jgi:hypothetical protein
MLSAVPFIVAAAISVKMNLKKTKPPENHFT